MQRVEDYRRRTVDDSSLDKALWRSSGRRRRVAFSDDVTTQVRPLGGSTYDAPSVTIGRPDHFRLPTHCACVMSPRDLQYDGLRGAQSCAWPKTVFSVTSLEQPHLRSAILSSIVILRPHRLHAEHRHDTIRYGICTCAQKLTRWPA